MSPYRRTPRRTGRRSPRRHARRPKGNNLGTATRTYWGRAAAWIQQEVDLTPYAGKEIQLRFEYVTDAALNLHGMAIDDIAINGVLSDDAESDKGWTANGFVRSTNLVAQRFVVQLLRFTGSGTSVDRRSVDGGTLDLEVDTSSDRRRRFSP